MKHNKKRNTAFLYEALVKELTKAILQSEPERKKKVLKILMEHFNSNSILYKELQLYKTLKSSVGVDRDIAEKILSEVKRVYHALGQQELYDEQTEVIKKINTDLSKKVYNNFIPNYKFIATVSQMFNSKSPINKRVVLEQKIIDTISSERQVVPEMKSVDSLSYNLFVNKFNEKYGSALNENQKALLERYISLSPDTVLEFKSYINEELHRLREVVETLKNRKDFVLDENLSAKSKELITMLEGFKKSNLDDGIINKILKIQALAAEVG